MKRYVMEHKFIDKDYWVIYRKWMGWNWYVCHFDTEGEAKQRLEELKLRNRWKGK